jgi:hypothetical protein
MDAATNWVAGKYAGALEFDGSNDHVDAGSDASIDNIYSDTGDGSTGMTVRARVYPLTTHSGDIVAKDVTGPPARMGPLAERFELWHDSEQRRGICSIQQCCAAEHTVAALRDMDGRQPAEHNQAVLQYCRGKQLSERPDRQCRLHQRCVERSADRRHLRRQCERPDR